MKNSKIIQLLVILFSLGILLLSFFSVAKAQEETPTPTAIEENTIKEKIDDLKERLATRVAELREQSKRAFFGQIKSNNDGNLIIIRHEKEQAVVNDEETVFMARTSSGDEEESSLASLELGDNITVFGNLDLDQKTLIAKKVIAQNLPESLYGKVIAVDVGEANFTIQNGDARSFILDYEISTRCRLTTLNDIAAGKDYEKCGLSKINIGDTVFVRAVLDENAPDRAITQRILLIKAAVTATPGITTTTTLTKTPSKSPASPTPTN